MRARGEVEIFRGEGESVRSKRSLWFIAMVLFLGAVLGTLLGEVIGLILPAGVVKNFFMNGRDLGFAPFKLDVMLFSITFGLTFKVNVVGGIGIFVAAYLLRWVLN
jgi:hypothetical protein